MARNLASNQCGPQPFPVRICIITNTFPNNQVCNSGDEDNFDVSVEEVKNTKNPIVPQYGAIVVALMERHGAELSALRKLHAGKLETPATESTGINTLYGRRADFDKIKRLIDGSSAMDSEKLGIRVSFPFRGLKQQYGIYIPRHNSNCLYMKNTYAIAICVTSSPNTPKRMPSGTTL